MSFLLQFRFIFASDIADPAADRMKDDAFYYLTCLAIKQFGFFTFDGINPTYGFHPLWMTISSHFLLQLHQRRYFFPRNSSFLFPSYIVWQGICCIRLGIKQKIPEHNDALVDTTYTLPHNIRGKRKEEFRGKKIPSLM